jgi:hypothetical protein
VRTAEPISQFHHPDTVDLRAFWAAFMSEAWRGYGLSNAA